jgi:predicted enzyme related to lactoylglutathione lyase
MATNPVIWFEIHVEDMGRARRFYEDVLGVTLERLNNPEIEMWAFPMEMGRVGAGGALVKMPGVSPGGPGTLVYFSCADCAVEAERVTRAGGRIHQPKTSIGEYGFIALAWDTEGNMFGLHNPPVGM